jgi:ATP-dependent Lon protease
MEIIKLPSYQETEKLQIAKRFLVPKQVAAAGLEAKDVRIGPPALRAILHGYTREAGVRSLEREIAGLCRKAARKKAAARLRGPFTVTPGNLHRYLGAPRFIDMAVERSNRVGIASGLAWTEVGGDLLTIEVSILPGKGELQLTGKLGDVMRESGHAALTWIRSRAEQLGLDRHFYRDIDIHVHVPEGAIPKDGPSAGITMATALVSALTCIPTRHHVSMTGEITLRGNVLPVGGLVEKTLAARRAGLTTVLLPRANAKDIGDMSDDVKEGIEFIFVDRMDDVLEHALERKPQAPEVPERPAAPAAEGGEGDSANYAH